MDTFLRILSCEFWSDCAKYVMNACRLESECSECCRIQWETTGIPLSDSDSETEIEVAGCCLFRQK